MLTLSPATRIFLAAGATDLRKSFNGLYSIVVNEIEGSPLSGNLFVFCNRYHNRIKVLYWDGSGLWVMGSPEAVGRNGLALESGFLKMFRVLLISLITLMKFFIV